MNFYLRAQLKELASRVIVENAVQLVNWGHSNNPTDSGSRRWYAGPRDFLVNLQTKNKVDLALQMQHQKASEYEVAMLNAKLMAAHEDLARSFFVWDENNLKIQFEHFVWLISSLCNWDIDSGMHCLQFNYQHSPFSPHIDGTGILQPKLMGGDGFGDQISVVNIKGGSWLFFAAQVPNTQPPKYVGFKARIPEGGLWAIEGNARYRAMHSVISYSDPGGVHSQFCHSCKITASLRNGYAKPL